MSVQTSICRARRTGSLEPKGAELRLHLPQMHQHPQDHLAHIVVVPWRAFMESHALASECLKHLDCGSDFEAVPLSKDRSINEPARASCFERAEKSESIWLRSRCRSKAQSEVHL